MAPAIPLALQAGLLAVWARAAAGARSTVGAGAALLQHQRDSAVSTEASEHGTCAELVSQDGFFVVAVEVGTPGQKFGVVADTGSNLLVVQSCACQGRGSCSKGDRCFLGTNRSASFAVLRGQDGRESGRTLTSGSGTITGVLARERVRVGELEADVKDGLLLMTSRSLHFSGPFEGILGLGVPNAEAAFEHDEERRLNREFRHKPSGLLEQAKVKRFAMCVNEDSSRGVLRLGQPEAPNTIKHASIGVRHWSLGFHGISIPGSETVRLQFCNPESMKRGQATPCEAYVDSGTELISGPPEHVAALLRSICDSWPRCAENHTAMVQAAEAAKAERPDVDFSNTEIWSKGEVLNTLLADCGEWMGEFGLDHDMPDLHFHIVGGTGTKETLILPARYYVNEIASGTRKVCQHGLDTHSKSTARNGPIWLLGSPFFYEFNVHFDLSSEPPSLAFESVKEVPCGVCDKKLGFLSTGASSTFRHPRKLSGPARRPSMSDGEAVARALGDCMHVGCIYIVLLGALARTESAG